MDRRYSEIEVKNEDGVTRVYVDGKCVRGVHSINFLQEVNKPTLITISILAQNVSFNGTKYFDN